MADIAAVATYGDRLRKATINLAGARTLVVVMPMLKDDEVVGAVAIYHQEVRPFTDKQIELVKNSPLRPLSPSRTPGYSTNCVNRSSNRPRPPTCSRSSAVHPAS